jgi:hypothetical protein
MVISVLVAACSQTKLAALPGAGMGHPANPAMEKNAAKVRGFIACRYMIKRVACRYREAILPDVSTFSSAIQTRCEVVPGGGIEPPTLRFSVACSTN